MDLPWGDEKTVQFITNVGLITTDGPNGQNIMAAEWTHHISYSPGLIAVCIRAGKASHENIKASKGFGVSLAATDQSVLSSVAGGSSGHEVDKIKAVQDLGFKLYEGRKIKALMVEGAAMNAECKLVKTVEMGSHTIFIGEVLEASATKGKEPLAYHKGKYWKMTETIEKPSTEQMGKIENAIAKSSRK